MGNFSRNTFDPQKNYVGVRMQQGVPVLDADWNELNDVTRQELYDTFSLTFTDGVQPNSDDLKISPGSPGKNNFSIQAGAALVQGRSVRVRTNLQYSTQPWTKQAQATRDGVDVIPPLTTPTGPADTPPRPDLVYLDVWEREVGSTDDASLINPAIGIETCVRMKREAAVRVAEAKTELPNAPAGHVFLPLTLLHRPVNQSEIALEHIEDLRPSFHRSQGTHVVSFFPAFLPVSASGSTTSRPAWSINFGQRIIPDLNLTFDSNNYHAFKTANEAAVGVLPLALPDGAILSKLHIMGKMNGLNGLLHCNLLRLDHPHLFTPLDFPSSLVSVSIRALSEVQTIDIDASIRTDAQSIVDNSRYSYLLSATTFTKTAFVDVPPSYTVGIRGIAISYSYSSLASPPRT